MSSRPLLSDGVVGTSAGRRGLLSEHIARRLERDILTGELSVGEKLPSERELAGRFSASRNVVRQVLRRLETKELIQEYSGHTELTDRVFRHAYTFEDGYLHPDEEPGIDVEIDDELASAHPYEPAYLPVNRLADGTVHDW